MVHYECFGLIIRIFQKKFKDIFLGIQKDLDGELNRDLNGDLNNSIYTLDYLIDRKQVQICSIRFCSCAIARSTCLPATPQ